MKITKKQLKQLIKEEILKEIGDDYHEEETFELGGERPPMTGQVTAQQVTSDEEYQDAIGDLMAKLNDPQYYDPMNPTDMIDDLHALMDKHIPKGGEPPEEEVPEEEVVDLRGRTPDIGRLRRKLKHGFEDWRK